MKKNNYFKNFYVILSLIIFLFILIISSVEIYLKLSKNNSIQVHETNYYGKKLSEDPYKLFTKQYFHPYYLFSLPWQKKFKILNNKIISINQNGFRNNPTFKENKKIGLLLGGSTAFGHFAKSDESTIAHFLTKYSELNFINLNAPSWNSHQELVALLKNNQKYDLSLSLSFANDALIYCYQNIYLDEYIVDQPENSNKLLQLINYNKKENNSLINLIKLKIISLYSETYKIYKKNKKKQNFKCKNKQEELVKSFIKNQKLMYKISKINNAKHLTIIQPIYSIHYNSIDKNKKYEKEFILFLRESIDKIMKDDFCKINCLNFSNVFEKKQNIEIFNGEITEEMIFLDEVHLSDLGNEILSKTIVKSIKNIN